MGIQKVYRTLQCHVSHTLDAQLFLMRVYFARILRLKNGKKYYLQNIQGPAAPYNNNYLLVIQLQFKNKIKKKVYNGPRVYSQVYLSKKKILLVRSLNKKN